MENSLFYIKTTNKSFDEAIESVKLTAKKYGFNLLAEFAMHNIFAKNGLDWAGNYVILNICNPQKAHHALGIDLRLGNFMPKQIAVFEQNNEVKIMLMKGDPDRMNILFPDKNVGELSSGVISTLISIIDESI